MSDTFAWYVGIDWGSEEHAVCLLDASGQVCGERRVAHTAVAVHEAIAVAADAHGRQRPTPSPWPSKRPRGVLVDTLIDQAFPVFAINPKQLDRFRDRFTAGGAKDDRRDGHALADGLRTDRARVPTRCIPTIRRSFSCGSCVGCAKTCRSEEQRLANRLRDQLYRIDAPWLALSPAADDPWLWTLLARDARSRQRGRGSRAGASRRSCGRIAFGASRSTTSCDACSQPRLTGAPGVADAVALRIASLVPQLLLVHEQRTAAERRIERPWTRSPRRGRRRGVARAS